MSGWDILKDTMKDFPPVAITIVFIAAAVVFIIGFGRHGIDFIRHGFRQTALDASLEKRFDSLISKLATKEDMSMINKEIGMINVKIETIEPNHFGHLKNFLTELTSILLDKGIINNENKARLDNQLRGM
jgi:hypothetical protein